MGPMQHEQKMTSFIGASVIRTKNRLSFTTNLGAEFCLDPQTCIFYDVNVTAVLLLQLECTSDGARRNTLDKISSELASSICQSFSSEGRRHIFSRRTGQSSPSC